jgi:preprotein translocase subunit YajC
MFVTPAYAQAAGGAGSAFVSFVPLILIFAIMYFLLIRPQQKKLKEHQAMVAALRRGDQVVTQGGLIGKVTKVKEDKRGRGRDRRRREGSRHQDHHRAGPEQDRAGQHLRGNAADRPVEAGGHLGVLCAGADVRAAERLLRPGRAAITTPWPRSR